MTRRLVTLLLILTAVVVGSFCVVILDERGLRYADVNKAAGTPLRVFLLPAYRYEIHWHNDIYSVEGRQRVTLASLPPQPRGPVARGEIHRAFFHFIFSNLLR